MLFRIRNIFSFLDMESYLPRIVGIVTCSLALSSCVLPTEDISSNPEYANIIGKKIRNKTELWGIGVTADQNYRKQIDYIMLVPGVGFAGPEVIIRDKVKVGSVFGITGVLETKSIINSTKYYLVKEVGTNAYKNIPIRIMITGVVNDDNYGLDKLVYEKID